MATVTENDLKRIEDLIINGQKFLETRLNTIETRLNTIETRLNTLEIGQTEIKGEIKALEAKVDKRLTSIETRLEDWKPSIDKISDLAEKVGEIKNWRQIAIIALTAFISSAVTLALQGGNIHHP